MYTFVSKRCGWGIIIVRSSVCTFHFSTCLVGDDFTCTGNVIRNLLIMLLNDTPEGAATKEGTKKAPPVHCAVITLFCSAIMSFPSSHTATSGVSVCHKGAGTLICHPPSTSCCSPFSGITKEWNNGTGIEEVSYL